MLFLTADLDARGKFEAPGVNSFTIRFDDSDPFVPGPVEFRAQGRTQSFDHSYAGETALWTAAGGGPDTITADLVPDLGPNGAGDTAARLTVTDANPGGYSAQFLWQVKGLVLGNSSGATSTGMEPIPDFNLGLVVTVPVRTSLPNASFRIHFETGSGVEAGRFDQGFGFGTYVQGNVPGLIDNLASAARVLPIGPGGSDVGVLPVNTWGTQTLVGGSPLAFEEAPSTANGWRDASFAPFASRAPRSFDLTRVGVSYPSGGNPGELLVSEFTMSGPDILKFHPADFNYDKNVDDRDIDLLVTAIKALQLNESLPPVPDNNNNGRPDFRPVFGVHRVPHVNVTLPEKFSITRIDNELNFDDVVELVEGVMETRFGDANLDGVVDGSDFGVWNANKFTTGGGWARGDFNGDGAIDGSDFGLWNVNKFTTDVSTVIPEPVGAWLAILSILVTRRRWIFAG